MGHPQWQLADQPGARPVGQGGLSALLDARHRRGDWVDAIADRLGIEPAAKIRLRAGINNTLLEASGEGNRNLPTAELLQLACELLAVERPGLIVSMKSVEMASPPQVSGEAGASNRSKASGETPTCWAISRNGCSSQESRRKRACSVRFP